MSIREYKEEKLSFNYFFKKLIMPLTVLLNASFSLFLYNSDIDRLSFFVVIALSFVNVLTAFITERSLKKESKISLMVIMTLCTTMLVEGGLVCINALSAGNLVVSVLSILVVVFSAVSAVYYYKRAAEINDDFVPMDFGGESVLA